MRDWTVLHLSIGPLLAAVSLACFGLAVWICIDEQPPYQRADRSTGRSADSATMGVAEFDGQVIGPNGPVDGAIVSIQATGIVAETNLTGQFRIPTDDRYALKSGVKLTAAHPEFIIAGVTYSDEPVTISLSPIPSEDNSDYVWRDPRPAAGDETRCAHCHPSIFSAWSTSGHANASRNRRFQNLHDGSTWSGGSAGWSLRDAHPGGAGVCFACHAPSATDEAVAAASFSKLAGVDALGVHCDFCHKVRDVEIEQLGLTHGRDAVNLLRPKGEREQLFFGPHADVDRGEDVYAPVFKQSQYCASCHEGTLFGMSVYTTYSEWLESAASKTGKSCQNCHMPPNQNMTNFAPGHGGLERSSNSLSTHNMLPGGRLAMLRSAIAMTVRFDDGVQVDLTTSGVGHATPTGYIDRHLLLIVEPLDSDVLDDVLDGPRLDSLAGEYENRSGRLFARVVRDRDGQAPTPFWKAFDDPIDTRLPPDSTTSTTWRFKQPSPMLRIRLLYRRFWPSVRKTKGWPDDTRVIFDRTIETPTED